MLIDSLYLQGNLFYRYRNIFPAFFLFVGVLIWINQDPVIIQYKHPQAEIVFEVFCLMISIIGLAIRSVTIGFNQAPYSISGLKASDKCFFKTGMYSIVRHPLYLGNFFIWLGLVAYLQSGKFLVCYFLVFTVIYERVIIAREKFLESNFGRSYRDWAKQIPAFFPNVLLYKKPSDRFSFRNTIVFEAPVFFFTSLGFYALEWVGKIWKNHQVEIFWHFVMAISILLALLSVLLPQKPKKSPL